MIALLKIYVYLIRKFLNKPKNIRKMHNELNEGYNEFLSRKDNPVFSYNNENYTIIPVETKVFKPDDDIFDYVQKNVLSIIRKNDVFTIAESVIAITEGRAYTLKEIKPSVLAYILSPWVSNVTYGTGLGMPETMECAIREIGRLKIIKATVYGFIDRVKKRHGSFYRIAGKNVKSIDFKKNHPVPFKNSHNYIVLSPKNPDKFCFDFYRKFNIRNAVVDSNNVVTDILACYPMKKDFKDFVLYAMKGNPAGQEEEKTPIVIIRKNEN